MKPKILLGDVLITKFQIECRVLDMAHNINAYANERPDDIIVLLCVLNGACVFMADLMRALHEVDPECQFEVAFINAKSYKGTSTSGTVRLQSLTEGVELTGRRIVIVEDIVDTGLTMRRILDHLYDGMGVKDVKICALLDKQGRREVSVHIDWACFDISGGFVVGYGMDLDHKWYRGLPDIHLLKARLT
ncbi:MAG: phosphoribosyltransferase family protein [Patescibacteria group bacterium]|jgi:hypoxanthine phosphoribosyltransferase